MSLPQRKRAVDTQIRGRGMMAPEVRNSIRSEMLDRAAEAAEVGWAMFVQSPDVNHREIEFLANLAQTAANRAVDHLAKVISVDLLPLVWWSVEEVVEWSYQAHRGVPRPISPVTWTPRRGWRAKIDEAVQERMELLSAECGEHVEGGGR